MALRSADAVLARRPDFSEALRLRGDALVRTGRLAEAAPAYEAALAGLAADASAQDKFDLETRLWSCYTRLARPDRAYAVLRAALGDLYRSAVGYRELAALATAALDAGDVANGRTLLEFALAKTPRVGSGAAPLARGEAERPYRALTRERFLQSHPATSAKQTGSVERCGTFVAFLGAMPLINLIVTLIVVGVLLWLVNNYIPMDGKIKNILNIVVVIAVVLWLLSAFGVLGPLSSYRVGP